MDPISAVYQFLLQVVNPALKSLAKLLKTFNFWPAAFWVLFIGLIDWVVQLFTFIAHAINLQTELVKESAQAYFTAAEMTTVWAFVAQAAALANCVLPLDFAVAMAAPTATFLLACAGIALLIRIYELIPGKAT